MKRRRAGGGDPDEDAALWRLVTSTVRPLRGRIISESIRFQAPPQSSPETPPAPATPPQVESPKVQATIAKSPKPAGPAPDRSGERRVRRGRLDIWGSLDLHGMTQDEARRAIAGFIARAAAENAQAVLVVTGKGGRFGGGEGVLKRRFPDWLADPGVRGSVSGIAPAHPKHGGA